MNDTHEIFKELDSTMSSPTLSMRPVRMESTLSGIESITWLPFLDIVYAEIPVANMTDAEILRMKLMRLKSLSSWKITYGARQNRAYVIVRKDNTYGQDWRSELVDMSMAICPPKNKKLRLINTACDLGFSVIHQGVEPTPEEILRGLRRRLSELESNHAELVEAVGMLDSYDEEYDSGLPLSEQTLSQFAVEFVNSSYWR